ncbi:P-loop ATPase, Sll1717 family [Labrys sp. WJW]|uniref:P-loop ATPase, Sll1717 family n=1 Tax=Labrys sp. WJW TaxID=1737983 RepID=UPI0012EA12C1|nr:ATPase [Labrys sp. WJW]
MMIDWIDFGQVSAERDENLSKYFFENGVLQAVIQNRHQFLVLGRKGAGKTAVFQHLSENPQRYISTQDISVNLSLQNYSWDVHGLLATDGKAQSLAYIQSWKYVIYLLAIKNLLEKSEENKKIKAAGKIISKIYTSPTPSLGQAIGQKLLQLSKFKFPSAGLDLDGESIDSISADGGEISFAEVRDDNQLQVSLNRSIERLSEIFEDALLDALSKNRRIFVSFDRIDEAWDSVSFENSQRIIAGLIGASEYINSKFKGYLRPIVFLREDIFETIDLNDKNKLRSDCGQLLAWSKDGLTRMILERVNFFAKASDNPELARVEDLFDRDQMRQQRAPFDHVMLRTMLRPRDFIRFFQLIKADMINRRDNPFEEEAVNESRLECQAIYNAEPAYSEWLVEELRDEWRAQFPVINTLFSAVQSNGRTNFTREDFSQALIQVGAQANAGDVSGYLKFLFDNSIIGFRVGKSNQWRYKCFFSSQGFVESDLYKVHDGLHRGLNLTESRSTSESA